MALRDGATEVPAGISLILVALQGARRDSVLIRQKSRRYSPLEYSL